jgi:hypothetical protein
MYEKAYEVRKEEKRFAAALKGIDIDEGATTEFDDIKRRAEAKAMGLSEEQFELHGIINIIDEDEEEYEDETE